MLSKARAEYYRDINAHLRPRRRKLLHEKDLHSNKSLIPTIMQADRIEESLAAFHRRVKSRKKMHLSELFAENISLFCRLNKQKSAYEQLFSKSKDNKQNRSERRKLKRCTSAHVNRLRTFEDEPSCRDASRLPRPFSSQCKQQRRPLTMHSLA